MWSDNLILGVGLNNFSIIQTVELNYYSHCNYIEMLSCLGSVGFMIYYALPVGLILKKINREDDLEITFKVIVYIILFMDIAYVSFQAIQIQIMYALYIIFLNLTNDQNKGIR